ncbi:hypothetical protein BC936DRAFT_149303 [Jimgerdemannia flammicorona]|uniref:Uncharacterized protein n=1 Tax=Jimgerdemannia flammicorona TaxID=994334 RepID=A0A433D135_9FUNG|nr:hypothetical protein BC936DRAFT_149303 [Jimgerdemannia flammicorona]
MTSEMTQALESYDQVPTLLSQRPSEKSDELLNWSEEALYRAALLRARLGYVSGFPPVSRGVFLYAYVSQGEATT